MKQPSHSTNREEAKIFVELASGIRIRIRIRTYKSTSNGSDCRKLERNCPGPRSLFIIACREASGSVDSSGTKEAEERLSK